MSPPCTSLPVLCHSCDGQHDAGPTPCLHCVLQWLLMLARAAPAPSSCFLLLGFPAQLQLESCWQHLDPCGAPIPLVSPPQILTPIRVSRMCVNMSACRCVGCVRGVQCGCHGACAVAAAIAQLLSFSAVLHARSAGHPSPVGQHIPARGPCQANHGDLPQRCTLPNSMTARKTSRGCCFALATLWGH